MVLIERGKYIPNTDRLALYKTLLMNAYPDHRLDYIENLIYKTYYHHPTIPTDTNEITYYTPSRNKKTITIQVTHSTVSQFILQDDHYVKTEYKIITRPYTYTEVIPLHRIEGSFMEDLKSLNQNKMLKTLVEV
jgi:hypothetical protein